MSCTQLPVVCMNMWTGLALSAPFCPTLYPTFIPSMSVLQTCTTLSLWCHLSDYGAQKHEQHPQNCISWHAWSGRPASFQCNFKANTAIHLETKAAASYYHKWQTSTSLPLQTCRDCCFVLHLFDAEDYGKGCGFSLNLSTAGTVVLIDVFRPSQFAIAIFSSCDNLWLWILPTAYSWSPQTQSCCYWLLLFAAILTTPGNT